MVKYAIITVMMLVVAGILYLVFWAPGRHDRYYCGLCGSERSQYYALGTFLVKVDNINKNKKLDWHDPGIDHIWLTGSSHPYNGGNYDSVDSQYAFDVVREMVERLPMPEKQAYKDEAIQLMKSGNTMSVTEFISRIRMRLTRR